MQSNVSFEVCERARQVCDGVAAILHALEATSAQTTELLMRVRAMPGCEPWFIERAEPAPSCESCEAVPPGAIADPLECLSAREREVLQFVAVGLTSRQIATRLCVSPKTVETYRSRLMTKLDLHTIPDLVRFAIRHDVVSLA